MSRYIRRGVGDCDRAVDDLRDGGAYRLGGRQRERRGSAVGQRDRRDIRVRVQRVDLGRDIRRRIDNRKAAADRIEFGPVGLEVGDRGGSAIGEIDRTVAVEEGLADDIAVLIVVRVRRDIGLPGYARRQAERSRSRNGVASGVQSVSRSDRHMNPVLVCPNTSMFHLN